MNEFRKLACCNKKPPKSQLFWYNKSGKTNKGQTKCRHITAKLPVNQYHSKKRLLSYLWQTICLVCLHFSLSLFFGLGYVFFCHVLLLLFSLSVSYRIYYFCVLYNFCASIFYYFSVRKSYMRHKFFKQKSACQWIKSMSK